MILAHESLVEPVKQRAQELHPEQAILNKCLDLMPITQFYLGHP